VSTANATVFRLLPSRRIALLIVSAHAAAATALLMAAQGAVSGWVVAALLLALGGATARDRALLRAASSVRGFTLEGGDRIVLELAGRGGLNARVAGRRWVSAGLVLLPVTLPRRRTLLVGADMLDPEAFRRLRLWALWGRLPGVASTPRGAR